MLLLCVGIYGQQRLAARAVSLSTLLDAMHAREFTSLLAHNRFNPTYQYQLADYGEPYD